MVNPGSPTAKVTIAPVLQTEFAVVDELPELPLGGFIISETTTLGRASVREGNSDSQTPTASPICVAIIGLTVR